MTDLLARARQVQAATLFLPGFVAPEEHDSFTAIPGRIRALAADRALGDRPVAFTPGAAAYPGFDPFTVINVRVDGDWLCAIADRWHDDQDRQAALSILRSEFA